MADATLYGREQRVLVVPKSQGWCCSSEIGDDRAVIHAQWALPPLASAESTPQYLSREPSRPVEVRPIQTQNALLEVVLSAIREEFRRLRETQVESDRSVHEQMLALDVKLTYLVKGNGNSVQGDRTSCEDSILQKITPCPHSVSEPWRQEAESQPEPTRPGTRKSNLEKMLNNDDSQIHAVLNDRSSKIAKDPLLKERLEKSKGDMPEKSKNAGKTGSGSNAKKHMTTGETVHARAKTTASFHEPEPLGLQIAGSFVYHPVFDGIVAICIALNCLLVGLQVNQEAVSDEDFEPFIYAEYIFIAIFTTELLLRILAAGTAFCSYSEPRYLWPTFDSILVVMSWIDLALVIIGRGKGLPGPGASIAKILKMARMARIVRTLRMTKFLAKVRVMGTIILSSMASLVWLFLLLMTIMYIFAIVLTQGATEWLKPPEDPPPTEDERYVPIQDTFGTVPRSMLTLFESVTGGRNWGIPNELAQALGVMHSLVFSFFIFFFFFSVLNIVTGVYVDGAIQQAHSDRAMQETKKEIEKKVGVELLTEILGSIDTDSSGAITRSELDVAMKTQEVRNLMELLEVNAEDADKLFDLINVDNDDTLTIPEFVDGMHKLKGQAMSIDVHLILCRVSTVISQLKTLCPDPA